MTPVELAALLRAHELWRKQLPTRGSYGPTLSGRPPSKTVDGVKTQVPPFWWCKTCGVEFPEDDERSWAVQQSEHQADVIITHFAAARNTR